jgi:hypothetical protein
LSPALIPDIAKRAALDPVIFFVLFSGLLNWFEVVTTGVNNAFYIILLLAIKSFSVALL